MEHGSPLRNALLWPLQDILPIVAQQTSMTEESTSSSSSSGFCSPRSASVSARKYLSEQAAGWRSERAVAEDLEYKEMRTVFDSIDEDSDGRITQMELANFVRRLNLSDCEHFSEHIKSILQSADRNGDGVLEYAEFLDLCDSLKTLDSGFLDADDEDQGLLDAFNVFDDDSDGFISPIELQAVVSRFRSDRGIKDCSRMIKAVDKDGDGLVNFQEFKEMMQLDLH